MSKIQLLPLDMRHDEVFVEYPQGVVDWPFNYDVVDTRRPIETSIPRFRYSCGLTPFGGSYNDLMVADLEGHGVTTAADEMDIQDCSWRSGRHCRVAEPFNDMFGRDHSSYMTQITSTLLRVPEGADPGAYEEREGRKYWPRLVVHGMDDTGEIVPVPEDGIVIGHKFGVPAATYTGEDRSEHALYEPWIGCFAFNPSPETDKVTGHQDVVITRETKPFGSGDRHLLICATYKPSDLIEGAGFRLVKRL